MLGRHFGDVHLQGLDTAEEVKAHFEARRKKAARLLKIDVLDLRHRMPHSWYVWAYTRLLPLAYKMLARDEVGGVTGITADDWFVTDDRRRQHPAALRRGGRDEYTGMPARALKVQRGGLERPSGPDAPAGAAT